MQALAKNIKVQTTKRETRKSGRTAPNPGSYSWPLYASRTLTLEGEITVEIDLDGVIKQLGAAAIKSKGKKAREINGFVVVTARNVREVAATEWSE